MNYLPNTQGISFFHRYGRYCQTLIVNSLQPSHGVTILLNIDAPMDLTTLNKHFSTQTLENSS